MPFFFSHILPSLLHSCLEGLKVFLFVWLLFHGNSIHTMEGRCVSSDQVFAKLIGMGFEFSDVAEAVKAVGPSVETAVEYILNGSRRNSTVASTSSKLPISNTKTLGKRTLSTSCSSYRMRQSTIKEHLQSAGRPKRSKTDNVSDVSVSGSQLLLEPLRESDEPLHAVESNLKIEQETFLQRSPGQEELDIGPGWEQKVKNLLLKHFGFSSLKSFQKDAVAAWLAQRDCLVLAATGSGIIFSFYSWGFCLEIGYWHWTWPYGCI